MQKSKIIKEVKRKLKTPDEDYRLAINEALEKIVQSLVKGKPVTLKGFGTFKTVRRSARNGRNPRTGEKLRIPAQRTIKFTPSQVIKNRVKNEYSEKVTTIIEE